MTDATTGATTGAPASRTGTLLRAVRRMPLFRQLVPMEAGVGWPIPVVTPDRVVLRLPIVAQEPCHGGTALYPPFAVITVDAVTGRPLEYRDLRLDPPWPARSDRPVGTFPHEAVRGTLDAYRADRERLLAGYDDLVAALGAAAPFPREREFGRLLTRLVEPSLLPFFRVLGPEFFRRFVGPA